MAFRDDREALRAHRDALAQERDDLREDLDRSRAALAEHEAKDEQDEAELARLRAQVERLEREAGERSGPAAISSRLPRVLSLGAAALVVLGLAYVLYAVQIAPDPAGSSSESSAPAAAEVVAEADEPPPPARLGYARWAAVVRSAEGAVDVAPGDGCVIEGYVPGAEVSELTVTCRDMIYDAATSAGTQMTMSDVAVDALSWPGGRVSRSLRYRDTGMRTGPRPQLLVDTARRSARVWREAGDPFDVRLEVTSWSAPLRGGEAPPSPASVAEPVRLGATVIEGAIEGAEGPCELSVHPENVRRGLDCRVRLRCGDRAVYGDGTGGVVDCVGGEELGPSLRAQDTETTERDGDPRMSLDLEGRRMTVGDDGWEATLALAPHPRCDLDGTWTGELRSGDGTAWGLTLTTEDGRSRMQIEGADPYEVEPRVDCDTGRVVVRSSGRVGFEGRFGPGFATLVGDRVSPRGLFWLRRAPE